MKSKSSYEVQYAVEAGSPEDIGPKGRVRNMAAKMPLGRMRIGESFLIPESDYDKPGQTQNAVRYTAKKLLPGRVFRTITVEGGVRVWRTA